MFGRALEALCRDVLFTREEKKAIREGTSKKKLMLADGIKQLRDKNYIDSRLFDWSQHLHAFRNLAAHPGGDGVAITRRTPKTFKHSFMPFSSTSMIWLIAIRNSKSAKNGEPKQKPRPRLNRRSGVKTVSKSLTSATEAIQIAPSITAQ
ncbi:DUF4145 domain-containing protein [Bradyrhizobium sp. 30]|nr:DUF4145 domain-containing protein [Bradyrhizobium sp. 30]